MMEHNSKYKLLLLKERSKVNATVREQQIRRGRHIARRKQQKYDKLDANGQGHYKHIGEYKPPIADVVNKNYYKITAIDIAANRELGKWNGYVYGMKKQVLWVIFFWWVWYWAILNMVMALLR